jgi:hypothetical protein
MSGRAPLRIPDEIANYIAYDPETGVFTWKATRGPTAMAGMVAGHRSEPGGYGRIHFDGKVYLYHRVAFFLMTGRQPVIVDHTDCNPRNDRWSNLREADAAENSFNRRGFGTIYPKGVRPAHQTRDRYTAAISYRGKRRYLGTFPTIEAAKQAYVTAAAQFHGEFARFE